MKIEDNKVAGIHYTLKGDDGDVIDSSDGRDPLEYLHGHGNIVTGLENALAGKSEGDKVSVSVSPEEGYGAKSDDMVVEVEREHLPVEEIEPGMRFSAETSAGMRMFTAMEVGEEIVKLDGNHPLAGENLNFDVEVVSIRDAEQVELDHGHVHSGDGDHDH